ncbi:MAG: AmmeMemoRadiSam system protein B, partial [Candidatus Aminicenantales bacterium]
MRRKPAVAGYFYPQQRKELKKMIESMVKPGQVKKPASALISPHAGYIYSGPVAAAVFSSVFLPDRFVILGPSHRGIESRFAIMKKGIWETPLGEVSVDTNLAELIINQSELITEDEEAHLGEHSLEVQLPFIQFFKSNFSLVPICIAYHASFEELEQL